MMKNESRCQDFDVCYFYDDQANMRHKKIYPDDDGHTIADMSEVRPQPLIFPRIPHKKQKQLVIPINADFDEKPWEKNKDIMSKEDRRMYIFQALKASLFIAMTYIVGLGAFILLIIFVWSLFD